MAERSYLGHLFLKQEFIKNKIKKIISRLLDTFPLLIVDSNIDDVVEEWYNPWTHKPNTNGYSELIYNKKISFFVLNLQTINKQEKTNYLFSGKQQVQIHIESEQNQDIIFLLDNDENNKFKEPFYKILCAIAEECDTYFGFFGHESKFYPYEYFKGDIPASVLEHLREGIISDEILHLFAEKGIDINYDAYIKKHRKGYILLYNHENVYKITNSTNNSLKIFDCTELYKEMDIQAFRNRLHRFYGVYYFDNDLIKVIGREQLNYWAENKILYRSNGALYDFHQSRPNRETDSFANFETFFHKIFIPKIIQRIIIEYETQTH